MSLKTESVYRMMNSSDSTLKLQGTIDRIRSLIFDESYGSEECITEILKIIDNVDQEDGIIDYDIKY